MAANKNTYTHTHTFAAAMGSLPMIITILYGTFVIILCYFLFFYALPCQYLTWHIMPGFNKELNPNKQQSKIILFRIRAMYVELLAQILRNQLLFDMFNGNHKICDIINAYLPHSFEVSMQRQIDTLESFPTDIIRKRIAH